MSDVYFIKNGCLYLQDVVPATGRVVSTYCVPAGSIKNWTPPESPVLKEYAHWIQEPPIVETGAAGPWMPWPENEAPTNKRLLVRFQDGTIGIGSLMYPLRSNGQKFWVFDQDDDMCDCKVVAFARILV